MSKFWSAAVRDLTPYVPGEQPKISDLIKLNTNENPFPPSPSVAHILHRFDPARLALYPDPDATELKAALAKYYGVDASHVFVGNGSDEVLAHAFMAFFRQDKPLLMPAITYSFYDVYCKLYQIDYQHVPLETDFSIVLDHYTTENGGIIFANPNAPTGHALSLPQIEALLQRNTESVVIVDEAYVDFGAQTAAGLINKYPNLLVIQTFSKSRSLAGMRVGFALGSDKLIEGLERVKNSFNSYPLDTLAQQTAVAALEDQAYFTQSVKQILATRQWTTTQLSALGFEVLPSHTNFVLTQHPHIAGAELMAYLRAHNILVRHFSRPEISNFLRISIGTQADMETLLVCLQQHPDL